MDGDFKASGHRKYLTIFLEQIRKLEKLAKKAVEDEESWIVVRGGSKVILINEDELVVKTC